MKRGFTLVELLAVIIVLGIIVGIAVPGITKIMEKSKDCFSFINVLNRMKKVFLV